MQYIIENNDSNNLHRTDFHHSEQLVINLFPNIPYHVSHQAYIL